MPDIRLPQGFTLDQPAAAAPPASPGMQLPAGFQLDPIDQQPRRTVAQVEAFLKRYEQPKPGTWTDAAVGFLKGAVYNTGKGLFDMAARVLTPPETPEDKAAFAAMGPLGPLMTDMARAHYETGRKAVEAAKEGRLSEAAGYAGAAALPGVGPFAAAAAEKIGTGDPAQIGEGLGDLAGAALLPKTVSKVKSAPVVPRIGRKATQVVRDTVAFAERKGIPLSLADRTGSKLTRNVEGLVQNQIGGAGYAQQMRGQQAAAIARTGEQLANEVYPSAVVPEEAATQVKRQMGGEIRSSAIEERTQYADLEDIVRDPANLQRVPVRLDDKGKPVMAEIPLPVDQRPLKSALRPIYERMKRRLPIAQQRASQGLHAIEQILKDDDYVSAITAEDNLGAIKAIERTGDEPAGLVSETQALAKGIIPKYDEAIRDAISQAKRSRDRAPQPQAVEPPALEPEQPAAPAAPIGQGYSAAAETTVRVPGSADAYPARYEVRELADVQPSHSGGNFQRNPNYRLSNERDYTNPENQRKVVEYSRPGKGGFDPAYLLTDNPDATNGPIIIDRTGNALGGNGRAMILQRVYGSNPAGATAYRKILEAKAPAFGVDPAQIRGMKQPVLVRVVDDANAANAIADFNKPPTAALTQAERMIADSRRMSPETLDSLGARLEQLGEDATIAQALDGAAGVEALDKLIQDGVISPQERAALAEGQMLTDAGRKRISNLVVGRFFKDPAQVDSVPRSIRAKIERAAAPLAKVEGIDGWGLSGHLADALDLIEQARSHGSATLADYLNQGGLFVKEQYSPQAQSIAHALQSVKPTELTRRLRQYADDAQFASGGASLFGDTPDPAASFARTFEPGSETVALEARPAAPAAPPQQPAAAPAEPPKVIDYQPASREALDALRAGRKATAAKYDTAEVLKQLREEPVQAFGQMTYQKDSGIALLREINRKAPDQMPAVGRAYIEDLLRKVTAEDDLSKTRGVLNQWENLGTETKKILYKNPVLIKDLDNFFQLIKRMGENRNPSGSAYVGQLVPTGLLIYTEPMTGAGMIVGTAALSRLLFNPKFNRALTKGARVPLGNRAAAAIAAGQIVKAAGDAAQPYRRDRNTR